MFLDSLATEDDSGAGRDSAALLPSTEEEEDFFLRMTTLKYGVYVLNELFQRAPLDIMERFWRRIFRTTTTAATTTPATTAVGNAATSAGHGDGLAAGNGKLLTHDDELTFFCAHPFAHFVILAAFDAMARLAVDAVPFVRIVRERVDEALLKVSGIDRGMTNVLLHQHGILRAI